MTDRQTDKILSLQGIRAVAFLGVFLFHCGIIETGPWAVSVFLMLSGFLMTYNYYDKCNCNLNFRTSALFSLRKIKKLYPLHITMMIMALLPILKEIFSNFQFDMLALSSAQVFANIFLIQAWIPSNLFWYSLNGVAWYLSVLVFVYMMFPVILSFLKRLNFRKIWIFVICVYFAQCIVSACAGQYFSGEICKFITYLLPMFRLGDFSIGCCLGWFYLKYKSNDDQKKTCCRAKASIIELSVILLNLIPVIIFTYKIGFWGEDMFRYNVIYTPFTALMIYVFSKGKGAISCFLSIKPLIWLANVSSSCFLTHQIIIRYCDIIANKFSINLNAGFRVCLAFIITIVFSRMFEIAESVIYQYRKSKTKSVVKA